MTGYEGHLVRAPEGGGQLPEPVAQEAFALGVAVPQCDPEYRAIVAEASGPDVASGAVNQRATRIRRGPPWRRLEANLYVWSENERQRLLGEAAA